ncbi:SDR family oxidoreductase [Sphingomonas sp. So64.6b]|uniref:SDR family oxidoreductase n=1 Tax=Sphingomonas sp. So64.6b TaxID=2997354 RepID=UPI0016041BFD|nr:SDR family oxidoreductase [Sphingomonas sp. So64.6b]QNA86547.1 SDR family oxidoreductase [Sphingomonas sp. So64.6b]
MTHILGKVAIVTGASSGLGRALALALAGAGMRIVVGARRKDRLDSLVTEVTADGAEALAVECDVRDEAQVEAMFTAALDRFGRIDVLINNAGLADHSPTDELSSARWSEVIDTNLTGAFYCAREALRVMKRQGGGRMIHVGSLSALVPRENTAAYAASKFALTGLNHSLALDGRAFGIASSIFHPGVIGTELEGRPQSAPGAASGQRIGADVAARAILAMIDLPDHVNFLEGTMLPLPMPFLGRG